MKNLFLIAFLFSATSFASTDFCVGKIQDAKGYDAIWGAFSYEFWCSNGLAKKFNDSGCFTDSCQDQARVELEKNEIASLGYRFVKSAALESFGETFYFYTKTNAPTIDVSKLAFANKVSRHRGDGEKTEIFSSKNGKTAQIEFGGSDIDDYIGYIFKDYSLIQKISRDTPGMQLSELSIFLKK